MPDGYKVRNTTLGKSGFRFNIAKNSRWNCAQDMRAYWEGYNRIDWSKNKTGSVNEQQTKAARQEGGELFAGNGSNTRRDGLDTGCAPDEKRAKDYPNL